MMALAKTEDITLVRASGLFDEKWYLNEYKDVAILGMDPVEHFLWVGWKINRSPSTAFCAPSYLDANPDVARAGLNPLLHYLRNGQRENRPVYPLLSGHEKQVRVPVKRIVMRRHREWDTAISDSVSDALDLFAHDTESSSVSVVMPTKNRAGTIGQAILSVLEQSHRNIELIIVDDGGSDDTQSIVESLNDGRTRYLKQEFSRGVSRARNIGLEAAQGDWVFFLDSDNTWRPDMVRRALKHAFRRQASAGYCAADLLDDNRDRKSVLYADFDFESCLKENFIDLNCFFVRWAGAFKSLRFDEGLKRLVDWDFILKVASHTRIVGAPYIGVNYYDGSNVRISNQEHTTDVLELLEKVRQQARLYASTAQTILDKSSYRIAVVLHVFHPEAVESCIGYLKNIEFDFDLFITTSLAPTEPCIRSLSFAFPNSTIMSFPNNGADIAPFLELVSTLQRYWVVCKIHTKRDVGKWGGSWRNELLSSVLASPSHVNNVINLFKTNKKVKMVCSKSLYKAGTKNSIPETLRQTRTICAAIDIDEAHLDGWGFAAGTMFWIKPQELTTLAAYMCNSPGYSKVFRQDGAIEHGLERVLGLVLCNSADALVGLADQGSLEVVSARAGITTEGVNATLTRIQAAE